ncbi:hypothetical protein [Jannaschia donghaensis]|nr:hypothetical protein [Jannaschia donghaensis]
MTRIARTGIAGLRAPSPAEGNAPAKAVKGDLRGSGSWANEWAGARSAIARAKAIAKPAKARTDKGAMSADPIPEGTITARPLMSTRDVKLHNWILDRLEAEAPCCTLHVGVALHSFLTAATAHDGFDPLNGLAADMLIVDETGQPIAAIIRENTPNPSRHLLLIDALLDADIPIVDIPVRPSLATLWQAISETLPKA